MFGHSPPDCPPSPFRRVPPAGTAGGFSLIEVLVATVIATVAVVGLAYTFSIGRASIDRFATARAALAAAQGQLEILSTLPGTAPELTLSPPDHTAPFLVAGEVRGEVHWTVVPYDDPADGPSDPNPFDLRRVTVEVTWTQGTMTDNVQLERLLPAS